MSHGCTAESQHRDERNRVLVRLTACTLMRESTTRWQFSIDRGGTFTDIVPRRPDGGLITHKLLSEHPERYVDAAVQGIRDLLCVAAGEEIPAHRISVVKMGTTV